VAGPIHLQPCAPLAERVLLPGDPGRALLLAQELLEAPKMFNHHRGLWGYTGVAPDKELLTIQSTGMGGPSAAIVIWELAELGARRLLRVGTCGALTADPELGDLVIASEALPEDGASRALGAEDCVRSSPELLEALKDATKGAERAARVVSSDLFYGGPPQARRRWLEAGAIAVEMETATLFTLAGRLGLQAASVLIVSDVLEPARIRISSADLRQAEQRMGDLALRALGSA
jgi:DeoD family purine-nucleoside phosphorylase